MMLPRTILVSIDLDGLATRVLDYAVELAACVGAKLHVVHAVARPVHDAEVPEAMVRASLDEVVARARAALEPVVGAHHAAGHLASVSVELGEPVGVILAAAEARHAELIITGTHGRQGVSRLFLGSVAEQIARRAPCPVTLIRHLPADRASP
ncbi:MAG TPA: universal stress protein [Kofleriaceae bacterium]|nr:universal stress protein [Kofleriaceae bacterium]